MILMWLKRFAFCSVTFTGGYITFWCRNVFMRFYQNEEKSSGSEDLLSYMYLQEDIGNDFFESVESSWNFGRKNNLPIYWKLFMLCKSKDFKIRHKAVISLSKLISLEKWQYVMIAQACDMHTSIGLARSLNASSHFFLPPPFRDLDKDDLQRELYLILSSLSFSNIDRYTQNLVRKVEKLVKPLSKNGYNLDLEVGDPSVIYHSQQKKKEVFLYDKFCLKTILACSSKSSHRNSMMEKGVLKVLLKVWRTHKKDIEIHSLIAQILANFAMEEKFRKGIYMTGWIGILAEWVRSPFISVNLPAAKALANLDKDDLSQPLYDDGVFVLNPLCRLSEREISVDVIFVHGLLGATFWTWRQCDTQKTGTENVIEIQKPNDITISKYSMCWPKDWLAVDIPSLRIISVDYKTCISSWGSCCFQGNEKDTINSRAREMIDKLLLSNVGERPIIWIAHSMGGLIVKKILTEAFESKDENIQSLAKKTSGLVFYSVPHKGSELANKINSASLILQPSNDIAELCKGSQNLLLLQEKFKDFILKGNIPVLSFGEMKKSRWGLSLSVLVPSDSADLGFGEFYTLPVDHLSTCKPVSSSSFEYLKVLNFLQEIILKTPTSEIYPVKAPGKIFEISKILCLIP